MVGIGIQQRLQKENTPQNGDTRSLGGVHKNSDLYAYKMNGKANGLSESIIIFPTGLFLRTANAESK